MPRGQLLQLTVLGNCLAAQEDPLISERIAFGIGPVSDRVI
jgi:hypothetical protein